MLYVDILKLSVFTEWRFSLSAIEMDDLPVLDFEDASRTVGGDERDDMFLVDLLVCFYSEALPRICKMLDAMRRYRAHPYTFSSSTSTTSVEEGGVVPFLPPLTQTSVEIVMKDQAHAMKGSAANIRLRRLAKAAENVEIPFRTVVQEITSLQQQQQQAGTSSSSPPIDSTIISTSEQHIQSTLYSFCISPCTEIQNLLREFANFTRYIENNMRSEVDAETFLQGNTVSIEEAFASENNMEALSNLSRANMKNLQDTLCGDGDDTGSNSGYCDIFPKEMWATLLGLGESSKSENNNNNGNIMQDNDDDGRHEEDHQHVIVQEQPQAQPQEGKPEHTNEEVPQIAAVADTAISGAPPAAAAAPTMTTPTPPPMVHNDDENESSSSATLIVAPVTLSTTTSLPAAAAAAAAVQTQTSASTDTDASAMKPANLEPMMIITPPPPPIVTNVPPPPSSQHSSSSKWTSPSPAPSPLPSTSASASPSPSPPRSPSSASSSSSSSPRRCTPSGTSKCTIS